MLRCAAIVIAIVGLVWGQRAKDEVLTVCEVLGDLTSYRGRRIVVRGELVGGQEGSALVGEGCKPLITAGFRWPTPTPIGLTNPESPTVEDRKTGSPPARVERVDPERLRAAGPDAKVFVTVIGRLETRSRFEMVTRGDGKIVPYGYGHLSALPAQLVYEEIKDVVVVPAKR